jgi:hypothetical protein
MMTLPGDFAAGDVLTDTDMDLLPAGVAGGGYDTTSGTDQDGITTVTAISGLTVTFTPRANRMYRVTGRVALTQNSSASNVTVFLYREGAEVGVIWLGNIASGITMTVTGVLFTAPGAVGESDYELRVATSAGTVDVFNSYAVAALMIEDAGYWV